MPEDTPAPSKTGSMEEKPCSSSAAACSVDVMEEAKKLIGTGNRHLVMGDTVSAVNVFQEACGMLAEKYGDTADECGEAFFLCGKALLELARMENTVLGNALEGVPEEESEEGEKQDDSKIESADNLDEETRDELREQVYDAMAEKEKAEEKKETVDEKGIDANGGETIGLPANGEKKGSESPKLAIHADAGPDSSEEPGGEAVEAAGAEESSEKAEAVEKMEGEEADDDDDEDEDDDDEGEKGAENKDSEEEEEVGNLQLAWEMLEVAKVIYRRKESKEDQLMAAQAYLKLGEVGAESGNYSQALEDFRECLALQLKYLPPHSRLLAETHYHLGVTFGYTSQYHEAVQHFNSSIKVIESRLAMLQETIDQAEGPDGATDEKREMEELMQLLPDIREKVEDTKESQTTAGEASVAIQQTLAGASTSTGFSCVNGETSANQITVKPAEDTSLKSASDISHLVRKKRKPEEACPVKDSDAKKVKQEATVNGGRDSASNGNGVQKKMEETTKPSASVETSS